MHRRTFIRLASTAGILGLLGSYAFYIERHILVVNHYKIPVQNLPPAFAGYRITQLTDLHLGRYVSEAFIYEAIQKANALNSDMIVCTGDYVHARNKDSGINAVWPLLSKLQAKDGVYSVLGNHDHWANANLSMDWMNQTGQNLRHRTVAIIRDNQRLLLAGAGDYWEDELGIDKLFTASHEDDCRILLSHNPDSMDTDYSTPIHLAICGYTHGGQVSIPFIGPPLLPVKNSSYTSGLILGNKTPVFISRGIGCVIIPVRVNCFPEIAVLELQPVNSSMAVASFGNQIEGPFRKA